MVQGRNEPIMKSRRLFSAMLALFPWLPALAGSKLPKPPLILPFAAHKAGSVVTTEVRIVEHRVYYFDLRLGFKENDSEDRKRVQKLAGGFGRDKKSREPLDYGISIPVRLKITTVDSSNDLIIYDKEIQKEEMSGFGANSFSKKIDRLELRPGHYRISLENLKDIPELNETPVFLGVGFNPKDRPID